MDKATADKAFAAAESGEAPFFRGEGGTPGVPSTRTLLAARNEDGRSLVHVSAAGGHTEVLEVLLGAARAGSSGPGEAATTSSISTGTVADAVNTSDEEGWTPLLSACSVGSEACVSLLLSAGADPRASNSGGRTALHYAASKGHTRVAQLLMEGGAEFGARDKVGCSPLHRAASAGQLAVCRLLLDSGAKVDATDGAGQTPLMMAVICDHGEVAELLIQRGSRLDTQDNDGATALSLCGSDDLREKLRAFVSVGTEGTRMEMD